jgi:hypothetical protein
MPQLKGAHGKIVGLYPHPCLSGEYSILFRRGASEDQNPGYYVLTVGSCQNQKPKRVGPLEVAGMHMRHPPIQLRGCLHWILRDYPKDILFVFDTMKEKFRSMRLPAAATGISSLLEMEGMLGMRCLHNDEVIMKIWVLRDYERDMVNEVSD